MQARDARDARDRNDASGKDERGLRGYPGRKKAGVAGGKDHGGTTARRKGLNLTLQGARQDDGVGREIRAHPGAAERRGNVPRTVTLDPQRPPGGTSRNLDHTGTKTDRDGGVTGRTDSAHSRGADELRAKAGNDSRIKTVCEGQRNEGRVYKVQVVLGHASRTGRQRVDGQLESTGIGNGGDRQVEGSRGREHIAPQQLVAKKLSGVEHPLQTPGHERTGLEPDKGRSIRSDVDDKGGVRRRKRREEHSSAGAPTAAARSTAPPGRASFNASRSGRRTTR